MLEHEQVCYIKKEELTSPVVKLHPGQVHLKGFSPVWVRECVSEIVSSGLEVEFGIPGRHTQLTAIGK
jgi:hypothetical protein